MSCFENNLQAIRVTQPILARELEATESLSPHAIDTPDGARSVRLFGAEGPWVTSRRAPKQEAVRIVRELQLKTLQPCVAIGCGLGYAIREALQKFPESKVVVLEKYLPLLRMMFETIDFSQSIAAERLAIAIDLKGQPAKDVIEAFAEEIAIFEFKTISHTYTSSVPDYHQLYKNLAEWVRYKSLAMRTTMHGAKHSVMNLLDNIPQYLSTPGVNEFRGLLEGVPGILVGAGPSLERNLDVIREFEGKAYVHAVSSALKRVTREGIKVHSTNVVDYSHLSERYFTGIGDNPPPLWVEPRTNPKVLDSYNGPMVLSDDIVYRRIFEGRIPTHGGMDNVGNNVAHYGLNILCLLGCNPIIFCGLDQAFSFHITHIPGTAIHDEWVASAHRFMPLETQELSFLCGGRDRDLVREDIYGNPLYTDNLMETSAIVFENIIGRNQTTDFINATEGGRVLRGAETMTLRDALKQYATKDVDFSPYLDRIQSHSGLLQEELEKGYGVLKDAMAFCHKMQDIFRRAKRELKKAEKSLLKRNTPGSTEGSLDRLNEELNEWRGVYDMVHDFCPADIMVRQKLEAVLSDESIPELDRLRLLAKRESTFVLALERALEVWMSVLKRGIKRLEVRLEEANAQHSGAQE